MTDRRAASTPSHIPTHAAHDFVDVISSNGDAFQRLNECSKIEVMNHSCFRFLFTWAKKTVNKFHRNTLHLLPNLTYILPSLLTRGQWPSASHSIDRPRPPNNPSTLSLPLPANPPHTIYKTQFHPSKLMIQGWSGNMTPVNMEITFYDSLWSLKRIFLY